jgi:hypothetical protein
MKKRAAVARVGGADGFLAGNEGSAGKSVSVRQAWVGLGAPFLTPFWPPLILSQCLSGARWINEDKFRSPIPRLARHNPSHA